MSTDSLDIAVFIDCFGKRSARHERMMRSFRNSVPFLFLIPGSGGQQAIRCLCSFMVVGYLGW
ncbi:hypothetical protein M3J09_003063 [Ascochyta lentis]